MSTTPVPVKLYSVALNRNVAPVAWEGFAGNPISITGRLPAGQDFAGVVSITAELHAVQSNSETPLAVSDALEELPTGGSVTLNFSSAAMNRAAGRYFISIYATYPDSRLEVFRVAEIHLVEGAISQLTPPSPAPALYASNALLEALGARVETLEEAEDPRKVVVAEASGNYTVGSTDPNELYGGVVHATAAGTITIPAAAEGMSFAVITMGDVAVSVDPNAADLIYLDGVALADGDKITNLSTAGDIAVFTYHSAAGWCAVTNGWTDGN